MTAGTYFKLDHYFFCVCSCIIAVVLIVLVLSAVLLVLVCFRVRKDKQGTSLITNAY